MKSIERGTPWISCSRVLPIPPEVDPQCAHNQLPETWIRDVMHLQWHNVLEKNRCSLLKVRSDLSEVSNVVALSAQLVKGFALLMTVTLPGAPWTGILRRVRNQVR